VQETVFRVVAEAVERETARTQDDHDTASHVELEAVIPHAESVLRNAQIGDNTFISIASNLRWHHQKRGRYSAGSVSERHR